MVSLYFSAVTSYKYVDEWIRHPVHPFNNVSFGKEEEDLQLNNSMLEVEPGRLAVWKGV